MSARQPAEDGSTETGSVVPDSAANAETVVLDSGSARGYHGQHRRPPNDRPRRFGASSVGLTVVAGLVGAVLVIHHSGDDGRFGRASPPVALFSPTASGPDATAANQSPEPLAGEPTGPADAAPHGTTTDRDGAPAVPRPAPEAAPPTNGRTPGAAVPPAAISTPCTSPSVDPAPTGGGGGGGADGSGAGGEEGQEVAPALGSGPAPSVSPSAPGTAPSPSATSLAPGECPGR